jgi:hypothetical protein
VDETWLFAFLSEAIKSHAFQRKQSLIDEQIRLTSKAHFAQLGPSLSVVLKEFEELPFIGGSFSIEEDEVAVTSSAKWDGKEIQFGLEVSGNSKDDRIKGIEAPFALAFDKARSTGDVVAAVVKAEGFIPLIEAWASQKSFRPKDGSGDADGGADFHGQKRKNDTHASTTDPDSRLYRKAVGREAKLSYMGHVTMENRHGLAVAGMVTLANGTAERRAAEAMLKAKAKEVGHRITVGEDKAYDTADHVAKLRAINVTPHVTQNASLTSTGKRRQSAIDARTTRHEGYGMSQSRRAMIECIFGWGKQHGTMRKTKHRGIAHVAADFLLNLIAYNLIRIPKLLAA